MTGMRGRTVRYHTVTLIFLLPWLICFGVFGIYPIVYSLFLSFTEFTPSGNSQPVWLGLENYRQLFGDPKFGNALLNSLYFVCGSVPLTILTAIPTGIMLDQNIRFRTWYRVSLFMPVVASMFVIATLFAELYAMEGIINRMIAAVGFEPVHWLKNPDTAMPAIIVMSIWASFGFYSLVILAALQAIPREYYEISMLEGVSGLRRFWKLTFPLIKPTIVFCLILNSILAFQVFGEIYIMTQGGPLGSTETAVFYIYDLAFEKRDMGYASAAAYLVFMLLACLSLFQIWVSKNRRRR